MWSIGVSIPLSILRYSLINTEPSSYKTSQPNPRGVGVGVGMSRNLSKHVLSQAENVGHLERVSFLLKSGE